MMGMRDIDNYICNLMRIHNDGVGGESTYFFLLRSDLCEKLHLIMAFLIPPIFIKNGLNQHSSDTFSKVVPNSQAMKCATEIYAKYFKSTINARSLRMGWRIDASRRNTKRIPQGAEI